MNSVPDSHREREQEEQEEEILFANDDDPVQPSPSALSTCTSRDMKDGTADADEKQTSLLESSPDNVKQLSSSDSNNDADSKDNRMLILSFVSMVVVGSANKIFSKLQTIPMYNYPITLSLLTTFYYIPMCFAYIIPASRGESPIISREQMNMPKWPFFIMGILDCMSSLMGMFAAVYLPGSLLVLLPQAAIPISMVLSKHMLGERYSGYHYAGAFIVVIGIIVVLSPEFVTSSSGEVCEAFDEDRDCSICQDETSEGTCLSHTDSDTGVSICEWVRDDSNEDAPILFWAAMLILSCIPSTFSNIYKEKALGETELDPVFLNGWIALFQFFISLIFVIPAGYTADPPIYPEDLPRNIFDGLKCYFGAGTVTSGCHLDENCGEAPIFVNVYVAINVFYNLLMILILKFGSTNILTLAMTVMVPIGNLAFSLPFMPEATAMHATDIIGLGVIMAGLTWYRFGEKLFKINHTQQESDLR
eukprot:CAMPEP_0116068238 /NCGR_PEP_ID=MMETSP0322-20121206/11536_1 /TAXON_ID=163516 /ORGANISM="Leptocylindrus danicus var. apora, Strain B651" /LENGTH=475 /DNA_ID=CAMNT_0003555299 /DNA_START=175 /DNA_END=1599 /DNA_ORIENTATION=+